MTDAAVHHDHSPRNGDHAISQSSPIERSAIDAAVRPVVVWLFLTGAFWLLASAALSFVCAVKLHRPEFLNYELLSFGRVTPAAHGAFVFGWCASAALGVSVWLLSRWSGGVAPGSTLASLGVVLWNAGVGLGVLANLGGVLRPISGMEFPFAAHFIMVAGLVCILVWVLLGLNFSRSLSVSAMFVLGGLAWLAWSLATGNLLIATGAVSGVVAQIVGAWTVSAFLWLFLVPVSLGAAYYLIPKVTGNPIFSGALARSFFWLYFVCAGVMGANRLAGGPVPLWLASLSAAAAIALLVPVLGAAYNLFATALPSSAADRSPTVKFVLFGLALLAVSSVIGAASSLRSLSYLVRFTVFDAGLETLLLRGGVTMILFGGIYFIMPRLSGCEWLSSTLISWHFLGSAYGACMAGGMLLLSGLAAGGTMSDVESTFTQVLETGSSYYWGHTIAQVLLVLSTAVFALHFFLVALRIGQPAGEPTLFRAHHEH